MKSEITDFEEFPVVCFGTNLCLAWDKEGIDFGDLETSINTDNILSGHSAPGMHFTFTTASRRSYYTLKTRVDLIRATEVAVARVQLEALSKGIRNTQVR